MQKGAKDVVSKMKDNAMPSTPRQKAVSNEGSHSKVSTKQGRPDPAEKTKKKPQA